MRTITILLHIFLIGLASSATAQSDNVQLQIINLQSPDAAIRANAASTLGRFKDYRAIDPLIGSLHDQAAPVRRSAALSLGAFNEPREVPPLIAAVGDPDRDVSWAVAYSLGLLQDARAIPALISAIPTNQGAVLGLIEMGRAAVPALIEALRSDNVGVRKGVADALGEARDPLAIPPLLSALHDPVPEVRIAVAFALTEFSDPHAADGVLAAMKDDDPNVRKSVAGVISRTKDPRAIDALVLATRDSEKAVQISALRALGQTSDERAVKPLSEALKSNDTQIRSIALGSLARTGQPKAIPELVAQYRNSTDRNTRLRALEGLGTQADPAVTGLLLTALEDPDGGIRMTAAQSLGKSLKKTKDMRAVKPLAFALANPANDDKQPFYLALSNLGQAAFQPLLDLVQDSRTCPQAAGYLAATQDERSIPVLLALLKTPFSGPDGPMMGWYLGPAEAAKANAEAAARAHEITGTCFFPAATALVESHEPRVIAPLIQSLRTPHSGRNQVPPLLARLGAPSIEPVTALFYDPDPEIRRLAASSISGIRDPRVDTALKTALEERNIAVLAGAYEYYVALGQPGSEDALVEALEKYGASGSQRMAGYFLNCGDVQLEQAARVWGRLRHFQMTQTIYGVIWGGAANTHKPASSDRN